MRFDSEAVREQRRETHIKNSLPAAMQTVNEAEKQKTLSKDFFLTAFFYFCEVNFTSYI